MRLNRLTVFCLCVTLLAMAAPTLAQEFRGRINGTVTDNTGAVLPGVTVTASSPALIQPQVQVTGADGSFRFLALNPGVYTIDFELTGFQNVKRQDVRVIINQTLTVDQQLNVATLQETVTVTGDSPIVDTSTTSMGTNFTKELLTEIPNARDVWAAMAQAPGIQMTAFDVGGSNTGNQSGFRSYGFDTQNQTRVEGIDTTEGTAANAGYFDFGIVRRIPGRRRGRGLGRVRRRRGAQHQREVGRRSLRRHVVQRLRQRKPVDRQRAGLPAGRPTRRTRTASSRAAHRSVFRTLRRDDLPRQRRQEAVRPQRRLRRPDRQAEGLVLHQLAPERQVRLHHRPRRRSRAFEAVEQVHLQGHVPGRPQQPDHRLPEQAREAAGQARHQPQHAALGRLLPELAQLSVEGGRHPRDGQPRVPRRALRQLVQLLPAAPGPRLRPV